MPTAAEFAKIKYPVSDFAEKFDVHPKTMLRAVLNEPNPSDWSPGNASISDVATAFNMDPELLLRVMKNREHLRDAEQASKMMGISVRRFHQKRVQKPTELKAVARHGRTIRYALTDIARASGL